MSTNHDRAERGRQAVRNWLILQECATDEDIETAAIDLIADVLHYLHEDGQTASVPVAWGAIDHYLTEIAEEENR